MRGQHPVDEFERAAHGIVLVVMVMLAAALVYFSACGQSVTEPGTRLSSTPLQTSEPERPVAAKAVVKALRQRSVTIGRGMAS